MKRIRIYSIAIISECMRIVISLTGIAVVLSSVLMSVSAQVPQSVSSKITNVTVFESQAQVVRDVQVHAKAGNNTIILKDLPGLLRDESLRIKTSSGVKITDIKISTRVIRDPSKIVVDKTTAIIDSLKNVIDKSANRIALYDARQSLIESFKSQFVKSLNEKLYSDTKTTHQWSELLQYIEKNLSQVLIGKRREQRIGNKAELELNNISNGKKQGDVVLLRLKDVTVSFQSESEQNVTFNPVYRISGCGWNAQYDLRVDSGDKTAQIQYYGMVFQSTGEDWSGVNLILSTADPVNNNELPELKPLIVGKEYRYTTPAQDKEKSAKPSQHITVQYVNNFGLRRDETELVGNVTDAKTREPLLGVTVAIQNTKDSSVTDLNGNFRIVTVPRSNINVIISFIGYKRMMASVNLNPQTTTALTVEMEETFVESSACVIIAERPEVEKNKTLTRISASEDIQGIRVDTEQGDFKFVGTEAKSLSTVFAIPAKTTIPSDNLKHKTTIAFKTLPATFEYVAVPRVSQAVYLKGRIVNANDYPLLSGAVSLFVDNEFVNTTSINTVVPTDTLELPLGVDNRIHMERKQIRKFTESGGTFSKSKTMIYNYENVIVNKHGTKETITVRDNFPLSVTDAVKVALIEPNPEEIKPTPENGLEWKIEIAPGEKRILPVKFTVTAQDDAILFGLE